MKRKADDSDAGGEGSERGSASSFVAFVCVKCNVAKSGSSFIWSHGGWCIQCVQQYRREEAERLRCLAQQNAGDKDNSKGQQ